MLPVLSEPESNHGLIDDVNLRAQQFRRCCRFLHQPRVLLRHLIHVRDRLIHLLDALALLLARRCDLAHDVCHPLHRGHDLFHRLASIVYQFGADANLFNRVSDQRLDLFGCRRAALRKISDLGGHHRKAAPLLAGARRFHRRVERQDVGLESDAVDHADDVHDLS